MKSEPKVYQVKYVISGHILERYTYEKNQSVGFRSKDAGRKKKGLNNTDSNNRGIALGRARKAVMRTINSNPCLNKFLTLTFEKNITDLNYSNDEFKKWVKRVNYQIYHTKKSAMKYVAVIEFQKRGAVHYHVLCDMPYVDVKELQQIWGHGFIKLNKIKGKNDMPCDNVGAYVCKYMTKDNDDERLKERKSYLMSRNLDKPHELYVGINEEDLLAQVYDLSDGLNSLINQSHYSAVYTNEYTGTVIYDQFNLKRIKKQ